MKWIQTVPVEDSEKPPGHKSRELPQFHAVSPGGQDLELEGGFPGHLHLGQQKQPAARSNFKDTPKIQGISHVDVQGMASSPAKAVTSPASGPIARGASTMDCRNTTPCALQSERRIPKALPELLPPAHYFHIREWSRRHTERPRTGPTRGAAKPPHRSNGSQLAGDASSRGLAR